VAERCVNWLKQWRAVATRYDKRACNCLAAIVIAAVMRWVAARPAASGAAVYWRRFTPDSLRGERRREERSWRCASC
jgi:hypothetical protein